MDHAFIGTRLGSSSHLPWPASIHSITHEAFNPFGTRFRTNSRPMPVQSFAVRPPRPLDKGTARDWDLSALESFAFDGKALIGGP